MAGVSTLTAHDCATYNKFLKFSEQTKGEYSKFEINNQIINIYNDLEHHKKTENPKNSYQIKDIQEIKFANLQQIMVSDSCVISNNRKLLEEKSEIKKDKIKLVALIALSVAIIAGAVISAIFLTPLFLVYLPLAIFPLMATMPDGGSSKPLCNAFTRKPEHSFQIFNEKAEKEEKSRYLDRTLRQLRQLNEQSEEVRKVIETKLNELEESIMEESEKDDFNRPFHEYTPKILFKDVREFRYSLDQLKKLSTFFEHYDKFEADNAQS